MKSILMSIQPYWVFLIIAKTMGWSYKQEKTVEVRKSFPKDKNWNKIVKIYCSKNKKSFNRIPKEYQPLMEKFLGKVIGEFVCDTFIIDRTFGHDPFFNALSCMSIEEIAAYCTEKEMYGWHISDLKIYDKSKELSEFHKPCKCLDEYKGEVYCDCLICEDAGDSDYGVVACDRTLARPPQSYCYVEEV